LWQGSSVAISADGNTGVIGAPWTFSGEGGVALVYTRTGGVWQQGNELSFTGPVGEETWFIGSSVAISAEGNTVIVGGRLKRLDSGAKLGKGDFLVAEADESDGSFLKLSPALAIITNIDNDHLDYWGSFDRVCDGFVQYAGRVPFYGCVIACLDDLHVRNQLPRLTRRVVTYGIETAAQVRASNVQVDAEGTSFDVSVEGKRFGPLRMQVPGRHNVLNALAATVVGLELGISFEKIAEGLAAFEGVGRRMELKGERDGIRIIDDYGHHPAEMRATIAAARGAFPGRRLMLAFQPHRYTRTRDCFEDFVSVLNGVDALVLAEVYAAGEPPIVAADGRALARALRVAGKIEPMFVENIVDMPQAILDIACDGDVVITMGAGSIGGVPGKLANG